MYTHKIGFISLSIIGVAAVLMVVTQPTIETQQASAVSQPVVKKVLVVKDPPTKVKSKVKKDPPRKRHRSLVRRCGRTANGRIVCRWVPIHFRGPVVKPPVVRPPVVRPPVVRPPVVRPPGSMPIRPLPATH
ncbi:MAG: hypothetical protein WBZ36_22985 [Candidatus Nitrosopolaris sp.]